MALTRGISDDIADATVKDGTVAGLDAAGDGIKAIAKALFTGGAPPAEARDAVKAGLDASTAALAGGDQYATLTSRGNTAVPWVSLTCSPGLMMR